MNGLTQAIYQVLSYGECEVEEMEDTLVFDAGYPLRDVRTTLDGLRRDHALVLTMDDTYAQEGIDVEFGPTDLGRAYR